MIGNTRLTITALLLFGSLIAQASDRIVYYHNDALGSPVAATAQNGAVLWREEYRPYGERMLDENPSKHPVAFTGKQEEARLGIQYFGARWYHPKIGRFLSMDPAAVDPSNQWSFNRYAYANNNPYSFVDPDGREVVSVNKKNNQQLERYINNLASGRFKFNNNNRLEMVSDSGGSGKSGYYTKQLSQAISGDPTITIDILSGPGVSISDVETSANPHTGDSSVTITNDTYSLDGFGDTTVPGTPDTNLAHELVEHAIPNMNGISSKNGIPAFRENIVRRENNLPKRSGEDH